MSTLIPADAPAIEHADALDWLAAQGPASATAVIYDSPYGVGTPVRGREDGAAGSVFAPFGFLYDSMSLCARVLRPGGIAIIFGDWRRMHDLGRIASMTGLRPASCVAWIRNRPGTGGLFRASWIRSSSQRGACRTRLTGRRSGTWWRPTTLSPTTWSSRLPDAALSSARETRGRL